MTLLSKLIQNQREINANPISIDPIETPISDLLSKIEDRKLLVKASMDNEIIDLEDFVKEMGKLNEQEKELKSKKQDYADAIVLNENNEVLLLKRSSTDTFYPDCWCLPGGKIENNESPSEAVVRELEEETNLKATSTSPSMEKSIDRGTIHYFICYVPDTLDSSIILDNAEHVGYCFASREKLSELNLLLDLEDVLKEIIPYNEPADDKTFGIDKDTYSNIIEEIVHNSPVRIPKDQYMLDLFKKGDITEEGVIDYIFKAHGDPSHKDKLVKKTTHDKNGKKVSKWVTKGDIKKLAKHAKNSSQTQLELAITEHPHPKVREAAHQEIDRRQKEEVIQEEPKEEFENHEYHGKEFTYDKEKNSYMDEDGHAADTTRLYQYHDMKLKHSEKKLNESAKELGELKKQKDKLNKNLLKAFYKKMEKTNFSSKFVDEAYGKAVDRAGKMGLVKDDIEEVKLRKILSKKIGK